MPVWAYYLLTVLASFGGASLAFGLAWWVTRHRARPDEDSRLLRALADIQADVWKIAKEEAPESLSEWTCPSCGATTRARMSDAPERQDPPDTSVTGWNSGAAASSASGVSSSPRTLSAVAPAPERTPPVLPPNTILAPPPMVGAFTLRDWMIHYAHREDIWKSVVADFYSLAASDAAVLAVFERTAAASGKDVLALVEEIQVHFLRALLILTHVGLTVRLAETLRVRHARLGITEDIYGRTVTALASTLTRYGVPSEAMGGVVVIADELKPYLVAA